MIIALDYDDTFTVDKMLWIDFIRNSLSKGHAVSFVTSRYKDGNNSDIKSDAKRCGIDVVYTGNSPKELFFSADIWIDNNPSKIISHASSVRISTI